MRLRRSTIAACVFLGVILVLGLVIIGPARYFAGNNVRADLNCQISHCNRESDDMKWRLTGLGAR